MRALSIDAYYLWLHKLGVMGQEAADFSQYVRPGMTVVEARVNIGIYTIYTLFLAKLVGPDGKVLAFEPDPRLYAACRENPDANAATYVILAPQALGAGTGKLPIKTHGLNSGDTSLCARPSDGDTRMVNVVALDDVLGGRSTDFVKLDVQGWEPEVFKGMQCLMKTAKRHASLF